MSFNSAPPKLWCLINSRTGHMIKGLAFNEARAAVAGVAEESRTDWWVWNEGWPEWKPLVRVRLLIEPIYRTMNQEPPPFRVASEPQKRRNSDLEPPPLTESGGTVISLEPDLEDVGVDDHEFINRSHRRFKRRFKVRINQDGREFVSHTKDISAGGLQLEDNLPEWVAGYCQILLIKLETKKAVQVTCSVVENQPPHQRTRLQILNLGSKEREEALENWLAA